MRLSSVFLLVAVTVLSVSALPLDTVQEGPASPYTIQDQETPIEAIVPSDSTGPVPSNTTGTASTTAEETPLLHQALGDIVTTGTAVVANHTMNAADTVVDWAQNATHTVATLPVTDWIKNRTQEVGSFFSGLVGRIRNATANHHQADEAHVQAQ